MTEVFYKLVNIKMQIYTHGKQITVIKIMENVNIKIVIEIF